MTNQKCFPEAVELDAYGNGGFRFADMSHTGSLLILPSGMYAWETTSFEDVGIDDFQMVFEASRDIEFLLFGTGERQSFVGGDLTKAFIGANVGLEVMDTGAAARTYNVLRAEGRQIAAALIAVD